MCATVSGQHSAAEGGVLPVRVPVSTQLPQQEGNHLVKVWDHVQLRRKRKRKRQRKTAAFQLHVQGVAASTFDVERIGTAEAREVDNGQDMFAGLQTKDGCTRIRTATLCQLESDREHPIK